MTEYARANSSQQAVSFLAADSYTIMAGATDLYPAMVAPGPRPRILDISNIPELRSFDEKDGHWIVPALMTWSELLRTPLPPQFDGLKAAAREIGGKQIQNVATICGNVCNASPAADGVPNLVALDAEVELLSLRGKRTMPVAEFITGNRRTKRKPDELVTGLHIPKGGASTISGFSKLGARRYLVISIAMAAVVLDVTKERRISHARIAIGACSAVAVRLHQLERDLLDQPIDGAVDRIDSRHFEVLSPIDDVRGTAEYRREAAMILTKRLVSSVLSGTSHP